ncbi:unnamed protein product [Prorocentrum cordatum]|uniref:Uncharacterized protein n=1 Tax=Prorocentrum cordatum TaxID=2364126 RepID=A0ABN9PJW3_9DINO|nr:unnamed protein product [Polarella glacialis]
MRAGVSNVTGKAELWAATGRVDPDASLWPRDGVPSTVEKVVTLDLLMKKSVSEGRAFIAHIAVNGHEHAVLLGAKKSLKKKLIRFLIFEVSEYWEPAGHNLGASVQLLWNKGYACFALLPQPVPLSGPFLSEALSVGDGGPVWFNVLCARIDDQGLRRVLLALDPEAPDFFGQYAGPGNGSS